MLCMTGCGMTPTPVRRRSRHAQHDLLRYSSGTNATARHQPALAAAILTGKHET